MPNYGAGDLNYGVVAMAGEADRIRSCNGRVLALKNEPHIQRVWLPHEDAPGLAMSRAFGDFSLKDYGIIAVPDVSYRQLSPKDQFIILATDGVRVKNKKFHVNFGTSPQII